MSQEINHSIRQLTQNIYPQINGIQVLGKAYMRPIQILLRTHKIDKLLPYGERTSLPQGLMIASKQSIHQKTYIPIHLQYRGEGTLQREQKIQVSQYHRKNLISLLKKVNTVDDEGFSNANSASNIRRSQITRESYIRERNQNEGIPYPSQFEIAICVCVYSEDASMLKQTLACIKQNIISLVKGGVRQDSIGVFVFFDGISKIHPSVLDFISLIEDLQINLKSYPSNAHTAYKDFCTALQIDKTENGKRKRQIYSKLFDRYQSMIIFNQKQLQDRKERTIKSVHKNYMQMIKLKTAILKLKVQPIISYQALPDKARDWFMQLAAKHKDYLNKNSEQILFDLLYKNIQGQKAICQEALAQAEKDCDKYISSKKNLAYISMQRQLIYSKRHMDEQFEQYIINLPKNNQGRYRVIQFRESQKEINTSEEKQRQKTQSKTQQEKKIHINLFFCVKYANQGKLSSHNWFFNGFCKQLNPHYVILLDVGLKAKNNSIFSMYQHLKKDAKLGGVCGYMGLKIEKNQEDEQVKSQDVDCLTDIAHLVVDIQRAQQVQYHFAHLLDKPFESLFKFIHVLPGAFSGYNMLAIHSPKDKKELILRKYFESLNQKIEDNHIVQTKITLKWLFMKVLLPDFVSSFFVKVDPNSEEQLLCNQNMNLAEDRILCFGIHKNGFNLAYLPDSCSEVDPIKNLHSIFGQRKRWINGSYFAFEKVKEQLAQFQQTNGTSNLFLKLQMLYLTLVNSVSYFSVSLFLFTFNISMRVFYQHVLQPIFAKTFLSTQVIPYFMNTMVFIYVFFILSVIYFSINLTYNNTRFKRLIYLSSTIMGIFSIIVTIVLVIDLIIGFNSKSYLDQQAQPQEVKKQQYLASILRYFILSMFILHAIPVAIHALMYRKLQIIIQVAFGVISFLFYNPTYLIILNIYALCRIDDISWGTKGRDQQQNCKQHFKQKWRMMKFAHIFKYLFWNMVLSCVFLAVDFDYSTRVIVTLCIMAIITIILAIKLILGLIYSISYKAALKQVKVQKLFDNFNFKSQIQYMIDKQRQLELTSDTVLLNISTIMKQKEEKKKFKMKK